MHIPRKEMYKELVARDRITLSENVRASGSANQDNWTGDSAVKRVANEFDLFNALSEFIIDLTEEDEEVEGEPRKSRCSKIAISMFAYLIKQKFNKDTFIASKLHSFIIFLHLLGSFHIMTKMAD